MPYSIQKTPDLIKVTYWGTLTNDDILKVSRDAIIIDGRIVNPVDRIEDMRKLESIHLGFNELSRLAQSLLTLQLPRVVKTAVLVSGPLQFGIARMFQTILHHPKMEIRIFPSEDEARRWLLSEDKDKAQETSLRPE